MNKTLFDVGVPFVAGGVVFLFAAFSIGAITATSTSRADVAAARIDERATMCQEAALAFLAESGKQAPADADAGSLSSAALAERFVVASGNMTNDRLIREACRLKLSA